MTNLSIGSPSGLDRFRRRRRHALGCSSYTVASIVFILDKGEYHPLVRPAVLDSLLGYGPAVLRVTVDLRRYSDLEDPDLLLAVEPLAAARGRPST